MRWYDTWRRPIILAGCSILVILGIWGTSVVVNQRKQQDAIYPITKE